MSPSIKNIFLTYLDNLHRVVDKIPEQLFAESLSADMFSLGMHAKICTQFALRGYYPLLNQSPPNLMPDRSDKLDVLTHLAETQAMLKSCAEVDALNPEARCQEQAGEKKLELPQPEFIHRFIIPNLLFHLGMVYAIARAQGVALSKGDFDGLHDYPVDFSFVSDA